MKFLQFDSKDSFSAENTPHFHFLDERMVCFCSPWSAFLLAASGGNSCWQKRQILASAFTVSAQNGHWREDSSAAVPNLCFAMLGEAAMAIKARKLKKKPSQNQLKSLRFLCPAKYPQNPPQMAPCVSKRKISICSICSSNVLSTDPPLIAKSRHQIYFWATAWGKSMTGVWEELGPTSLAFLEYLLIGVAGRVSPVLLNREGVGRGGGSIARKRR